MVALHIEHLADRTAEHHSGGERQLVTIARVMAQEPAFVLFDEPTSALDAGRRVATLRLVATSPPTATAS